MVLGCLLIGPRCDRADSPSAGHQRSTGGRPGCDRKDTPAVSAVRGLSDLPPAPAQLRQPAPRGCGQWNHRGGVFSFGGQRAARIPVLATVRRDRRPRPSAVPRVRRREKPGRHHSSAGIVGCRSGSAAMLHRNDPERAGVGFGDGTTHLGLPADFLLDADGTVAAVHYGRHADDQWSVDQLIDINRSLGGKGTQ